MSNVKLHTSGHLQLHESGHLKLGGVWHDRNYVASDLFAGFAEIIHQDDWESNEGGENEDPNDFLSTVKATAEANFSTDFSSSIASIYGIVGYHGYQVYPLGWPGAMRASATCFGRWQKYSTGGITASSVKISTTGSANARISVFGSEPTATQIKSASGTSSGVYLFNKGELEIYNNNDYIWISLYVPVPVGLTIPVAQNTNADHWDSSEDPPQWYLGTAFWRVLHWKNSGTPYYKEEIAALNKYLNVYY